jgi:nucleoside-diphosphate-sugar epimerase
MTNAMTVLVTGASGTLGTAVLPRLVKDGHDVRPMSRRVRPGWVAADLLTGAGLTDAVRGVDAIVHLASSPTRTRATDVEGTRRLLAAAKTAGVRHVLFVSINGIDRIPLG